MNVRTLLTALLVVGVGACLALPAFTEEPDAPEQPAQPEQPSDPMTEAWKAAGTPGPEHDWMGFMVGSWDVGVKSWMGPGEPQTSEGRMETHWHLGRRYLRLDYSGDWEGEPFAGEATMGFDNTSKRFKTVWIDSGSTDIARAEGTRKGDVVTMTGTTRMPMMGEIAFRTVYTKKSDDLYVMEDYWTMEGMEEMKVSELTCTRAK